MSAMLRRLMTESEMNLHLGLLLLTLTALIWLTGCSSLPKPPPLIQECPRIQISPELLAPPESQKAMDELKRLLLKLSEHVSATPHA